MPKPARIDALANDRRTRTRAQLHSILIGCAWTLLLVACRGETDSLVPPDAGLDSTKTAASDDADANHSDCGTAPVCFPDGGGWCWSTPSASKVRLASVWGGGDNDVWVGTYNGVLHWNECQWKPFLLVVNDLENVRGVGGSGVNDAWAVGSDGSYYEGGLIWHWNGKAWSRDSVWRAGDLNAVWASSPTDAWVVGAYFGGGVAEHWNGSAWSDNLVGYTFPLTTVWGSGPNDAWAGGGVVGQNKTGAFLHWDGQVWAHPSGGPTGAISIWGTGPKDVWVGEKSLFHYDGVTWSSVPGSALIAGFDPKAFWGSGPSDVWTVGSYGANGEKKAIWHWDGAVWNPLDTVGSLNTVWGRSAHDVWAVGDNGTILHHQ